MPINSKVSLLIVDLDDTIFPTSALDNSLFEKAISLVEEFSESKNSNSSLKDMLFDLRSYSFDVAAKKHQFPESLKREFILAIEGIEKNLDIVTYPDYSFLKALDYPKVLVTTGFEKFQRHKIQCLGIQSDFEKIYIDDPNSPQRIFKKGIFSKIIEERKLETQDVWVIGDNPQSELVAGKELGMNTVLRRNKFEKNSSVDYEINSFKDIENLF